MELSTYIHILKTFQTDFYTTFKSRFEIEHDINKWHPLKCTTHARGWEDTSTTLKSYRLEWRKERRVNCTNSLTLEKERLQIITSLVPFYNNHKKTNKQINKGQTKQGSVYIKITSYAQSTIFFEKNIRWRCQWYRKWNKLTALKKILGHHRISKADFLLQLMNFS